MRNSWQGTLNNKMENELLKVRQYVSEAASAGNLKFLSSPTRAILRDPCSNLCLQNTNAGIIPGAETT